MFVNKITMSIAIVFGVYLFFSGGGLLDLISIKKDIGIKKNEIVNLENKIKEYKEKIKEAKTDIFVENYARTKLGMVKKDELIYEPKQ